MKKEVATMLRVVDKGRLKIEHSELRLMRQKIVEELAMMLRVVDKRQLNIR